VGSAGRIDRATRQRHETYVSAGQRVLRPSAPATPWPVRVKRGRLGRPSYVGALPLAASSSAGAHRPPDHRVSSAPAEKRINPSGTASPPHLPRRSAVTVRRRSSFASSTRCSAPGMPLGTVAVGKYEGEPRSRSAASAPSCPVRRVARPSGMAQPAHFRAARTAPRQRQAFGRLPVGAQLEGGQRAVRQPGLHWPGSPPRPCAICGPGPSTPHPCQVT